MTDNRCADRGTLADVRYPIPSDPHTFAYRGVDRVVPCSHLRCGACGGVVRWLDGARIEGGGAALAEAWQADAPAESTHARQTDAGWRFYFCRCEAYLCTTAVSLHLAGDLELRLDLPEAWACAGHPPWTPPGAIQGVEIADPPDWRGIIRQAFRAPPPDGDPHFWARWLPEVYGQLAGTPHRGAIDGVIGDLLVAEDAALRAGALYLLWDSTDSPAVELLPPMLLEDGESLRLQEDPRGDSDLYDVAARAIAYHVRRGRWPMDGALRDALRAQALRPGRAGGLGWLFAELDVDWLLDQADLLIERSPGAAEDLAGWRAEAEQRRALGGG